MKSGVLAIGLIILVVFVAGYFLLAPNLVPVKKGASSTHREKISYSKLFVFNNELYSGSGYDSCGLSVIRNGSWVKAADCNKDFGNATHILSFADFNGHLWAGTGWFSADAYYLDGNSWKASVIGLGKEQGKLSEILALEPYHGKLFAGTYPYAKVFEFDGNSWKHLFGFSDENMHVYSLAVFKEKLFIGFDKGAGIWSFDGNNLAKEVQDEHISNVYSLTVANGKLYAGSMGFGDSQANVLEFDGNSWRGIGFSGDLNCGSVPDNIFSMANFNGKLFIGSSRPGGHSCAIFYENGAWINSKEFSDYTVFSLQQFQGKLYAGLMPSGKIRVFDGFEWK